MPNENKLLPKTISLKCCKIMNSFRQSIAKSLTTTKKTVFQFDKKTVLANLTKDWPDQLASLTKKMFLLI